MEVALPIKYSEQSLSLAEINDKIAQLLSERLKDRNDKLMRADYESYRFEQKLAKGSFADRSAQMVLELKQDPVLFEDNFKLFAEEYQTNFRNFFELIDFTFEIVENSKLNGLLCTVKGTLEAKEGKYELPEDDTVLLKLSAENKLLDMLTVFTNQLSAALNCNVPNFRKLALEPLASLMTIPGFSDIAINLLVSKLGDEEISTRICKLLSTLLKERKEVKIIISIFEQFEKLSAEFLKERSGLLERSLRQIVIFLGFNLSRDQESLCLEASRIILNFLIGELDSKKGNAVDDRQQESQLLEECIITLTKMSKICDLRAIEQLNNLVEQIIRIALEAEFTIELLIFNFLVQLLYSFQFNVSGEPREFSASEMVDLVIDMSERLVIQAQFEYVNAKFYQFQNSITKLHKLLVSGLFTNSLYIQAIWRKQLQAALAVSNPECITQVMMGYITSVAQNNLLRRQKTGYQGKNCVFNISQQSATVFDLKQPLARCAADSPAYELLLLKRSVNPASRLFAQDVLSDKLSQIAVSHDARDVRNEDEVEPKNNVFSTIDIRATKAVIKGDNRYEFGRGNEINQIALHQLRKVVMNRGSTKQQPQGQVQGKTDDQIALESLKREMLEEEYEVECEEGAEEEEDGASDAQENVPREESGAAVTHDSDREMLAQAETQAGAPTRAPPAALRIEKKMKW